jgi:UDP-N-acetylmuramate: L-alanyl-gamma-D-glutamyl-meso-diaminopimelate ligase
MHKRVHIVGIAGVATGALAVAFKEAGWLVSGSDKGFFPPVSTALEEAGVHFYPGWHPEKMAEQGAPDIVIVGAASGSQNPETLYAREKGWPIMSDAEARGQYFTRDHAIVCVGTWGKTSSTALLSHILTEAEYDPSYVIGGLSLSTPAAHIGEGTWSVIEGDEYRSAPWDNRPKFAHAHPTHLLLTAVSWDHADVYPTEKDYFHAFETLVGNIPARGLIVANHDHAGVHTTLNHPHTAPHIWYGKQKNDSSLDYSYSAVTEHREGLTFTIHHGSKNWTITTSMIGAFQAENITGCFAMAHQAGIAPETIVKAIQSFKGLKRRLERRYVSADITIIDDIAHSPEKAQAILETIRRIYQGNIVAIFEPNIGGRERAAAHKYQGVFTAADTVYIPRLSKLKTAAENTGELPMDGAALTATIGESHPHAFFIEDDTALVKAAIEATQKKPQSVIVFLGAHGFRGMIDSTIEALTAR